ncbi:hypothetical protein LCGC14_1756420 [marine sediment metagenome]|uniref:PARP-type domain-containing protein n=1 Tax=marine sediment metagenome TaxID=412755 RepID=A0A0F9H2D6_9ZZZZ
MRLGNLQSSKARKEQDCVFCDSKIEQGIVYVSLVYKGKKRGWWSRRFHLQCLPFYIEDSDTAYRKAPKKGSAGVKGGRPRLDINPEQKKRRRHLLQYLNNLDTKALIKAYDTGTNIDKVKLRMLSRIDELEDIGVSYPSPFRNRALNEALHEHDTELYADLSATSVWTERIEILRKSING